MTIDWSQRTIDIARQIGVDAKRVSKLRRRLAPETVSGKGGVKTQVDWRNVDWSMPTLEIAKVLSVAPSTVSTWRMKMKPETSKWGMCK
jgi:Mn-dependent DtxR family transcriptional regulator